MFKSQKHNKPSVTGTGKNKAHPSKVFVGALVAGVAVVVIGGGAAATFIAHVGPLANMLGYDKQTADTTGKSGTTGSTAPKVAAAHQESVKTTQTKIYDLVQAGGDKSVIEAEKLADSEVAAADKSGDDAYVVSAGLAKAQLLIDTNRPQEALDSVLLPLDNKYGTNESYRYQVYGMLSLAYRQLDNQPKADEYFNKIPGGGFN